MKHLPKIIITFLILSSGFLGFKALKASAPDPKSKEAKNIIPEARYIEISPGEHAPPVRTFGTVSPYFETTLTPQVSGQIIEVSPDFRVGQRVKKGSVLVRIDRTDFEAAYATQQSLLAMNEQVLAEENLRAKQASEDWIASGRKLSDATEFVLREPQLAAAKASIEAARATLEKASIDIERTVIKAPFDALVTARSASLGNFATPQVQLGTLIATERVEVSMPFTAEQLQRVTLPNKTTVGPTITLRTPILPDAEWTGRIVRTAPVVSRDQVVTLIGEIVDPFSTTPPLSIGTFTKIEVEAKALSNTYEIPESALVNDQYIWVIDSDDMLNKIPAKRLHADGKMLYVELGGETLTPPLKLLTRPLTTLKSGMKVKPIQLSRSSNS